MSHNCQLWWQLNGHFYLKMKKFKWFMVVNLMMMMIFFIYIYLPWVCPAPPRLRMFPPFLFFFSNEEAYINTHPFPKQMLECKVKDSALFYSICNDETSWRSQILTSFGWLLQILMFSLVKCFLGLHFTIL